MTIAVKTLHSVPVRLAEVFEASMFERVIHVIALVVGLVVAIPMIVVHMRQIVDAPSFPAILLGRRGT